MHTDMERAEPSDATDGRGWVRGCRLARPLATAARQHKNGEAKMRSDEDEHRNHQPPSLPPLHVPTACARIRDVRRQRQRGGGRGKTK